MKSIEIMTQFNNDEITYHSAVYNVKELTNDEEKKYREQVIKQLNKDKYKTFKNQRIYTSGYRILATCSSS